MSFVRLSPDVAETYPVHGNDEGHQEPADHPIHASSAPCECLGLFEREVFRSFRHGVAGSLSWGTWSCSYLVDLRHSGIVCLLRFFDAREFVGGNVILTMIRELSDKPPEGVGTDTYGSG